MPVPFNVKRLMRPMVTQLAQLFFACVPRFLPRPNQRKLGMNLIGYYKADLGLGEALRYMAKALAQSSIPFLIRQFSPTLRTRQGNHSLDAYVQAECSYMVNCIIINPDMLYRLPIWVSYAEWTKRYNIGHWFWELSDFPKEWRYALPLIDEIWVNSDFNAQTMRQAHPRVTKIPFAIEFEIPGPQFTRAYFNLPQEGFLFLSSFDFHSSIHRKNPHAVIDAFLMAFADNSNIVRLAIKSIHGDSYPNEFMALKAKAQNDPRIIFIDSQFTTEEMRGLLQCADCYVSLHRSEGVGLGMAESMYLGKPVIATAYSGNMEFMSQSNACLISYQLIDVKSHEYPHANNQVWAEVSIQEAAMAMQKMISQPVWRQAIATQARKDMLEHHSFKVMEDAMTQRLIEIEQLLL